MKNKKRWLIVCSLPIIFFVIGITYSFFQSTNEKQWWTETKIGEKTVGFLASQKIKMLYLKNGGSKTYGAKVTSKIQIEKNIYYQVYQYGVIVSNNQAVYNIPAAIGQKYLEYGGPEMLGMPTSKSRLKDSEVRQSFEFGEIFAKASDNARKLKNLSLKEREETNFSKEIFLQQERLSLAFSGNSVNATSFRKNAITSLYDKENDSYYQFTAYYDGDGDIVIAYRKNRGRWRFQWTGFSGTISDAHNAISITGDGEGYLHMAWSDHAGGLKYSKSEHPFQADMKESSMLNDLENQVTYPEFYNQPNGNLLFLYRNGVPGDGSLVLNQYQSAKKEWQRITSDLITGEGQQSPYWQAVTDSEGRLHISWVWRKTTAVETNYDMNYMVSTDESCTSFVNGEGNYLPSPVSKNEECLIQEIPQNSSLINQTSMTVDGNDVPYIVSYWREEEIVQYRVIYRREGSWRTESLGLRKTDFNLTGGSTKQLPCARPQILVKGTNGNVVIYLLFRDEEYGDKAMLSVHHLGEEGIVLDKVIELTTTSVGEWEPTYDIFQWQYDQKLTVFIQNEHFSQDTVLNQQVDFVYLLDINLLTLMQN